MSVEVKFQKYSREHLDTLQMEHMHLWLRNVALNIRRHWGDLFELRTYLILDTSCFSDKKRRKETIQRLSTLVGRNRCLTVVTSYDLFLPERKRKKQKKVCNGRDKRKREFRKLGSKKCGHDEENSRLSQFCERPQKTEETTHAGINVCTVPNKPFSKLKDDGTIFFLCPKAVFLLQATTTSYS